MTYRILHLEDSEADQLLLAIQLKGLTGIEVELTQVGRLSEALEQLHHCSFDLVVSDLQLAECEGAELLRAVVAQADGTPVVACSGHPESFLGFSAHELGAAAYISKDVMPESDALARVLLPVLTAPASGATQRLVSG